MFGDNLKALRIREKMTQQELADALQITKRAVSSYELNQREPNFEIIKKIAYFFNASLDYLFDIQLPESSDTVIDKKQNIIAYPQPRHFWMLFFQPQNLPPLLEILNFFFFFF